MTVALVIALVVVVAAFIVERRLMVRDHTREREAFASERETWRGERDQFIERQRTERDALLDRMRDERHDWANERSALLDRVKPETAQPPPHLPGVETFQPPATDQDYWDRDEVVIEN